MTGVLLRIDLETHRYADGPGETETEIGEMHL